MFIFLFLDKPHHLCPYLQQVCAAGQVSDIDLCALGSGDKLPYSRVDTQGGIIGNTLHAEDFMRRVGIDDNRVGLSTIRRGGDNRTAFLESDFDDVVEGLVA